MLILHPITECVLSCNNFIMQINIMIYVREPHFEVYQATKSITQHAFVEFIKNSIFLLKHGFLTIPSALLSLNIYLASAKKIFHQIYSEKKSKKRINSNCAKIVEFQ